MISLGIDLELNVIVEGIETQVQETFLNSLGCHSGQGFMLTKPLPVEQLETFMLSRTSDNIRILNAGTEDENR